MQQNGPGGSETEKKLDSKNKLLLPQGLVRVQNGGASSKRVMNVFGTFCTCSTPDDLSKHDC